MDKSVCLTAVQSAVVRARMALGPVASAAEIGALANCCDVTVLTALRRVGCDKLGSYCGARWGMPTKPYTLHAERVGTTPRTAVGLLLGEHPMSIGAMARRSGWSAPMLARAVRKLERDGAVVKIGDGAATLWAWASMAAK